MPAILVIGESGVVARHGLVQEHTTIGRDPDNDVVLSDSGVSGRHCVFVYRDSRLSIQDVGSTNGTYFNGAPIHGVKALASGDRIRVASFVLEVEGLDDADRASQAAGEPTAARSAGWDEFIGGGKPPSDLHWRTAHRRYQHFAEVWDQRGRPSRLLLRGADLDRAAAWLASSSTSRHTTKLQRAFVHGSLAHRRRHRWTSSIALITGTLGLAALLATLVFGNDPKEPTAATTAPSGARASTVEPAVLSSKGGAGDEGSQPTWVTHTVIPAETLEDIAVRYDVPAKSVARWNALNPDDPSITAGKTLRVKATKRPLPQQRIIYQVEPGESWRQLSERFDVPVKKLRAYNSGLRDLESGREIVVWIDPKPPRRPDRALPIPSFDVRGGALSIGSPAEGQLHQGIQLPKSSLYIRRAPHRMWGSSHAVLQIQRAFAAFRRQSGFDAPIVVADLSKPEGGRFEPHKSHQSGRDVDIWLPMLRGVYKDAYLYQEQSTLSEEEDWRSAWGRRPEPDEADWFATWNLVQALVQTGEVRYIFLQYELQEKVYQAAQLMGASAEELGSIIQWPRGHKASGVLVHSDNHIHHIHVRFKCARGEQDCRG